MYRPVLSDTTIKKLTCTMLPHLPLLLHHFPPHWTLQPALEVEEPFSLSGLPSLVSLPPEVLSKIKCFIMLSPRVHETVAAMASHY